MEIPDCEPPSTRKGIARWTNSVSHSKWECKYQVVYVPKCNTKTVYAEPRRHPSEAFRRVGAQGESRTEATPTAALSGSKPKAPGFAGDTYCRRPPTWPVRGAGVEFIDENNRPHRVSFRKRWPFWDLQWRDFTVTSLRGLGL
jgi:hypothetical protein